MSRAPSSNRYVPVSMPMQMPVGLQRAYYYPEHMAPDYADEEMDQASSAGHPYPNWMETPGGGEQDHSPVKQSEMAVVNRDSHHMQMRENMGPLSPSDVTELYRRKTEDRYVMQQEMMVPDDAGSPRYFYRQAQPRFPQHRIPAPRDHGRISALPPMTAQQHVMPHASYYHHEDPHLVAAPGYEHLLYHSTPILQRSLSPLGGSASIVRRHTQQLVADNTPIVSNLMRTMRTPSKRAISVRTPRYYRRANVYKRPSALCLPVGSEPDPAGVPIHAQRSIRSRAAGPMTAMGVVSPRNRFAKQQQQLQNISGDLYQKECTPRTEESPSSPRSAPPCFYVGSRLRNKKGYRMIYKERKNNAAEINEVEEKEGQEEQEEQEEQGDDETSNPDTEHKTSDIDLLLNHYQQLYNNTGEPKSKAESKNNLRVRGRNKNFAKMNISQLLKPRLPPSLKNLQKRNSSASKSSLKHESAVQKTSTTSNVEQDRVEIEKITSTVLDSLLQDLNAGGITDTRPTSVPENTNTDENIPKDPTISGNRPSPCIHQSGCNSQMKKQSRTSHNGASQRNSSFQIEEGAKKSHEKMQDNVSFAEEKEVYEKMINNSHYLCQHDSNNTNSDVHQIDQLNISFASTSSCNNENFGSKIKELNSYKNTPRNSVYSTTKKCNSQDSEEHTAMELHRSKSYIVNLIDRALSRELGTIPEDRSAKQYISLEARTAMDLISSPAAKSMDNDLCLEITQVLAESLSNAGSKELPAVQTPCGSSNDRNHPQEHKSNSELLFTATNDEPTYIKQLKKLRWGHLKHIQREMRRLEDLERFLDSCSTEK